MNKKLYDSLEVCLQALEQGTDLDAVLERYPELSPALRPVLEASMQAQSLARQDIPEATLRRGRARLLQQAAHMREVTMTSYRPLAAVRRLAVSLTLAFLLLLGVTGLARASATALPGDQLYRVKRTWEEVRLLLVFDATNREQLEGQFAQERVGEIRILLSEGREANVDFTGIVEEQNGNHWLVSGIPVQMNDASLLPEETVWPGATVSVTGHTNQHGYVEAYRIEMLQQGDEPAKEPNKEPNKEPMNLEATPPLLIQDQPQPVYTPFFWEENTHTDDNENMHDENDASQEEGENYNQNNNNNENDDKDNWNNNDGHED
ncbi:MAG: hypothetical protein Fur0043_27820 [Anaerolineales bacterium]